VIARSQSNAMSRPLAAFPNSPTRAQSTIQQAEDASVAEKPARKPTRVATRPAPKTESPLNSTARPPASKVDYSMQLEDFNDADLAADASPVLKHGKVCWQG
jgi:hypothetical protein